MTNYNAASIDNNLDTLLGVSTNNYLFGNPFQDNLDTSSGTQLAQSATSDIGSQIETFFSSTTGKVIIVGVMVLFGLKIFSSSEGNLKNRIIEKYVGA